MSDSIRHLVIFNDSIFLCVLQYLQTESVI